MATVTLAQFLHDRHLLALKISSSDLGGLFRKSFAVPLNTVGLALYPDGTETILQDGQEASGRFDLVLAKRGEATVKIAAADLPAADGLPLTATCAFTVELALGRLDLFRDFVRTLFTFPGTYSLDDLKTSLAPEVRRVLTEFSASRPVAELHRQDHAASAGEKLRGVLERHLFDAGVRYGRLIALDFVSEEHERRMKSAQRRAEEDRRAVEVMDRKEQRLRRLGGILKDQQVQSLLSQVPDERLKGLLYAKLMEDDALQISAEDLLSKASDCGEEVVHMIYRAMEGLLSTGASVAPEEVPASRADRIFAAAGPKVIEIDPARPDEPRTHVFPESLRSIRDGDSPDGVLLLGGTKRGVLALLTGTNDPALDFPLPSGRTVKGGVNSIALRRATLYATHSEYGLAAWDIRHPGKPGELIHADITGRARTTRAVQVTEGGGLAFASGSHVYLAAADAAEPVKYVSSVESPVTCIATAARTVFAGTESGAIVAWKMDAPDQPVILVRKREAIVTVRLAKICGIPHLLYSARDLAVRARVVGQSLETSYDAEGQSVGALDAASDLICAADTDGRRVLLWKATAPTRPERRVDVFRRSDKPILDLWMRKVS